MSEALLKPNEFKIQSYYIDKSINPSLISIEGSKNIKELITYLTESVRDTADQKRPKTINKALSINQLRKFYDSFLKIYNNKSTENEKKVQLLMLNANAEYSAKRLETNRFKIILDNRIKIIISKTDEEFIDNLKAFKLHFEALVAYYPK